MDQHTLSDKVRRLLLLFALAESQMLLLSAMRLAGGVDAPRWEQQKLAEVTALRMSLQRVVMESSVRAQHVLTEVLAEYNTAARLQAVKDLVALGIPVSQAAVDRAALPTMAEQMVTRLTAATNGAATSVANNYRDIVTATADKASTGTLPQRQVLADVMAQVADRGAGAFVDAAGRTWQLQTYADMAIQTTLRNARLDARLAVFRAAGQDYVLVSSSACPCPLCADFEQTVLSLGDDVSPDDLGDFTYAGTYDAALATGLMHPGCQHDISPWIPDLTPADPVSGVDPEVAYGAQQKQRYHERQIRDAKRRVAMLAPVGDTPALTRANGLLAARSARLRAHLATPEAQAAGLRRRYDRERIAFS